MQFLVNIPSNIILAALVLGWFALAVTRWRPALLLDLGCILIYLRNPSIANAYMVIVQHIVRNVPTLAAQILHPAKLNGYGGWTKIGLLFVFPALDDRPPPTLPAVAQATTGATQRLGQLVADQAAQVVEVVPLLLNQWIAACNKDITAPHLGVVGPTRLGKTTLVLLLLFYRLGSIVVVTPKSKSRDPWGGIDAVRLKADPDSGAIDWSPMVRAVAAVHREMLQRNAEDREGEPITLVIDELTTFLAENPGSVRHVIDIWTMGAGAGIFLIAIATDINVKGWKIEGRRDVIDNLVFVKVEDGRRWTMGRIDPNGRIVNPRPMITDQLLDYARHVDLTGRLWAGLSVSPVWVGASAAPKAPQAAQTPDQTAARLPIATDAMLDDLLRAGATRDEAAAHLRSRGYGLDTNRWRDRRQALGIGRARRSVVQSARLHK
jgi:hypothetical protein